MVDVADIATVEIFQNCRCTLLVFKCVKGKYHSLAEPVNRRIFVVSECEEASLLLDSQPLWVALV